MNLPRALKPGLLRSTLLAIVLAMAFVYAAIVYFDVSPQNVLDMFLFSALLLGMMMLLAWLLVLLLKRGRR